MPFKTLKAASSCLPCSESSGEPHCSEAAMGWGSPGSLCPRPCKSRFDSQKSNHFPGLEHPSPGKFRDLLEVKSCMQNPQQKTVLQTSKSTALYPIYMLISPGKASFLLHEWQHVTTQPCALRASAYCHMAFITRYHNSRYYLCQQNAALQIDGSLLDFQNCTFHNKNHLRAQVQKKWHAFIWVWFRD